MQEGHIGLLKAAQSFNPVKAKFSTYSYRAITWAIIKYHKKQQKHEKLAKLIREYEI